MVKKESLEEEVLSLQKEFNDAVFQSVLGQLSSWYHYRISVYNIPGYEWEDLFQECLITLKVAIDTFDPKRKIMFETYAVTLADNRLRTLYRQAYQSLRGQIGRNVSLNDKVILKSDNGEPIVYEDVLADRRITPNEDRLIKRETLEEVLKNLSDLEERILIRYFIKFEDQEVIMKEENLSRTQFRGALDRVSRKIRYPNVKARKGKNYYRLFK